MEWVLRYGWLARYLGCYMQYGTGPTTVQVDDGLLVYSQMRMYC